jgi:hypothetical protein
MADWIPWYNRDSDPEPRIHEEFTERAARRFSFAVKEIAERSEIKTAYEGYCIETGRAVDYFAVANTSPAKQSFKRFVTTEDFDYALTLLELLLNEIWTESEHSRENHPTEELLKLDRNLRRILVEEGILLRIHPDHDRLEKYTKQIERYRSPSGGYSNRHRATPPEPPEKDFNIHFDKLADASVIDSDQRLRALGKQGRWEDELDPYNDAWEQYQEQHFTHVIPEKLYNSLEAVLEKICVEEQGWNSSSDSVGSYLSSLQDNGLFEPNEAMVGEWQQIIGGIQVGIQRSGGDRKRHGNIDQDYCILLLHQVGAFLTFIINRYEDQYHD